MPFLLEGRNQNPFHFWERQCLLRSVVQVYGLLIIPTDKAVSRVSIVLNNKLIIKWSQLWSSVIFPNQVWGTQEQESMFPLTRQQRKMAANSRWLGRNEQGIHRGRTENAVVWPQEANYFSRIHEFSPKLIRLTQSLHDTDSLTAFLVNPLGTIWADRDFSEDQENIVSQFNETGIRFAHVNIFDSLNASEEYVYIKHDAGGMGDTGSACPQGASYRNKLVWCGRWGEVGDCGKIRKLPN